MQVEDFVVEETMSIIDVMNVINDGAHAIAFVCKKQRLLATVSDGDIRRFIIARGNLNCPISTIANYNPIYVYADETIDYQEYIRKNDIRALPIINRQGKLVNIEFENEVTLNKYPSLNIPVVIMAGGRGTRLFPYTQILPKPLIPIGEKTITEHIMKRFEKYGCNKFTMIVNYKKEFIKSYFQEIENEYSITFVDEPEFWGTAGGLKLLESHIRESFFMTNCDILIDTDYEAVVRQHKEQNNIITLVCAKKKVVVPYGTVELSDNQRVKSLVEKPEFEFITNTGLYVIEPEFLELIPTETFIHITDMIQKCIELGKKVGTYLINELDWMDMGQMEELEQMKYRMENKHD